MAYRRQAMKWHKGQAIEKYCLHFYKGNKKFWENNNNKTTQEA